MVAHHFSGDYIMWPIVIGLTVSEWKFKIKNTSESAPCSYKTFKAAANKAQKKWCGFNRVPTHDLHDTNEMPVSCMEIMHYRYCRGHGFETHWSLRIFLGFLCNWLRCFTTVRITAKLIISPEKRFTVREQLFCNILWSLLGPGQRPGAKS